HDAAIALSHRVNRGSAAERLLVQGAVTGLKARSSRALQPLRARLPGSARARRYRDVSRRRDREAATQDTARPRPVRSLLLAATPGLPRRFRSSRPDWRALRCVPTSTPTASRHEATLRWPVRLALVVRRSYGSARCARPAPRVR